MKVAITVGHRNRPSHRGDRGASFDGVTEVQLVEQYVGTMVQRLRELGHEALVIAGGEYHDQWREADEWGATVYLNCHVNAGKGDKGLIFWDCRSNRGQPLALAICHAMEARGLPWWTVPIECGPDTNGVPRDADFAEPFACVRGVKAVGLCLEPYFIDGPRRAIFRERIGIVGMAIAEGIAAWGG